MSKNFGNQVEQVKITVEKRWQAARRLAAGDDLHLAAARAGLHEDQLAWLLESDPGFVKLSQSAKAVRELPTAQRKADTGDLALEALEDQLSTRNATVLNQTIKLLGELDPESEDDEAPIIAKSALLYASMTWKELTQFLWIGVRDTIPYDERGDMPFDPPPEFAERIKKFTKQLRRFPVFDDKPANDDVEPETPFFNSPKPGEDDTD